jgi:thiosulfate reductase cytochrome b subunit
MAFLITSISGLLAFFLVLITLMLPYILRRQVRTAGGQAAAVWQRMKIHAWIGYAILALVTLHMYISMGSGMLRQTSVSGINLATLALLLIFVQVGLGMSLERASGKRRPSLRRLHFVLMLGIVVLTLAHLVMNSALLHALVQG